MKAEHEGSVIPACYSPVVGDLSASLLGMIVDARSLAGALVLAALFSSFLRLLVLLLTDRGRGIVVDLCRALGALAFLAAGLFYALVARPLVSWGPKTVLVGLAVALLVLVTLALGRRGAGIPIVAGFLQVVLLLVLVSLAIVTLLPAGFVGLTEDRAVLRVHVTGETRLELVRWAPPGRPAREESLEVHRVVFETPSGAEVAEVWLYGDQVAVKGRVLRFSPFLNAAGLTDLFELLFAHNGYYTPERHNTEPHLAVPLPPQGPLAVHPWWRPLQVRILERWERGTLEGSPWAVRSVTTESTYFPLVDADGKPIVGTFRLVLTPGGLTEG
jgi:hypothetical protein